MIYEINGKYYVLANHRFYEVKVEKDSNDNFDVKLVNKAPTVEYKREESYKQVTLEEAYKSKKNHNLD